MTLPVDGPDPRRLLLIADLSGYTEYLVGGEAEEAPLIAGDLVETIVGHLTHDFEIAGLEGDAAFVHAPLGSLDGPHLIEAIGGCHDAFRRRIESVRQATTCTCEACRRAPTLELKFFVHVGPVARQRILGRDELAGRDVILIHRLLKGSEPAALGMRSYALLTDATVSSLSIDPAAVGLRRVSQEYDHFGEVIGWVGDPSGWLRGTASRAAMARKEDPDLDLEVTVECPPQALWELLTVPAQRELWEGIERVEELSDGNGRGVGTRSRCVARRLSSVEEIIEWRPPHGFARAIRESDGSEALASYDLVPDPSGAATRLHVRWYSADRSASPTAVDAIRQRVDRLAVAARDHVRA